MAERPIDLRSDTVTRPTPAMRASIAAAEVGDDMSGEDPTVNRLQEKIAGYFGMESALFVPSATMANQIAIRAQTHPGDELICESTSHVYVWEAGGPAALSGVMCRTIEGEYGVLDVAQLEGKIRPDDQHYVRTRLICLENTHNRGGGRIFPIEKIAAIARWARANGLAMHLDGARIWNAIVASGIPAREWARHFNSISVCFSKGLGAPIGSCLVGSREFMARAHRIRKLFGGAMRQVGIVAAGALFAFENNIDRLAEDHHNARVIAQAFADIPGCRLEPPEVQTNLVWIEIDPELGTAKDVQDLVRQQGVLLNSTAAQVCRACTHLDVSAADAERAAEAIRRALRRPAMV